jgi:hypothetical protein
MSPRERLRARVAAAGRRLRRIERRGLTDLRRWVENTDNLLHLTALVAVPVLVGGVIYISETLEVVPFLLFPPLAAGTYTLFADPGGRYATPWRFVGGLTLGALCGVAALDLSPSAATVVSPASAALAVLLTGAATWALDAEFPTAFSTALLVLTTGEARVAYLAGMGGSALLVAAVFAGWRRFFYQERARYLYSAVQGDDHVLVPVGEDGWPTVAFGARLAAAHDAGKVVLLDVVDDAAVAVAERETLADHGEDARTLDPEATAATEAPPVRRLEATADRVREQFDLPCEVVVAAGDPETAVRRTVAEANCDLVAVDFAAPYARRVLGGDVDTAALRSVTDRDDWPRVLVLVARPGDSAHAMIDFAGRLAGDGRVSVCTCIDDESERRRAEARLANLVETTTGDVETRVARSEVAAFVAANASVYDLVLVGASRDRSRASRLVVPPLFERLDEVAPGVDVAVVNRP